MQDQGTLLATDVHEARLERVRENLARLAFSCVAVQQIAEDGSDVPAGPFDAILLDVPCSNTGVLGRRPEARWRIQKKDLSELAGIQHRLCRLAVARLAPGGRLLYSTCTIEPEENELQVARLLQEFPQLQLAAEHAHFPGRPGDGGYQALLVSQPADNTA